MIAIVRPVYVRIRCDGAGKLYSNAQRAALLSSRSSLARITRSVGSAGARKCGADSCAVRKIRLSGRDCSAGHDRKSRTASSTLVTRATSREGKMEAANRLTENSIKIWGAPANAGALCFKPFAAEVSRSALRTGKVARLRLRGLFTPPIRAAKRISVA